MYEHIQVISTSKRFEPNSDAWLSVCTLIKVPRLNNHNHEPPYIHELPEGSFTGTQSLDPSALLSPFISKYYFVETYENLEEGSMHIVSDLGEHARQRFEDKMYQGGECSDITNTVIIMKLKYT